MPRFFLYSLLICYLVAAPKARAQAVAVSPLAPAPADTLRLTLLDAERQFGQRNLAALAQSYNVSIAQAQAVQARIIDNPTLYVEQDVLNRRIGRPEVPAGTAGNEAIVTVQQLFSIAGRRRAAGRAAQAAAVVEQYNLQDLLRNLRYQLRTTFYDVYFKQQTLKVYDTEVASLQRTVALYQAQYEKGNIALKDVIRLKAFLFTLESERLSLRNEVAGQQADLHVLLRDSTNAEYRPAVDARRVRALSLANYPEPQLADSALVRRADLLARQADVQRTNLNLRYQRTLAAPDLALGYTYDHAGSYINNYNALTVGVAVPVFNRNQGNIQVAKAQQAQSQALLVQQQLTVRRDVHQAYVQAQQADALYQNTDRDTAPFARLMNGIEQSYAKRVLGIVEYLDFYEAYKNNVAQINSLRASRMRAFEGVNLAVGRPIFRAD